MVPGLGLVPAQINLQSCVPAVQVHNYHTITQTICVPLIVVTMAVPPSIHSCANTRSSLGPTETATVRRIWLPGPGVSTLPYTASDLRNNRYWCWAEPQKAQFVHIASLLHPAFVRTRGHDASAPHPLCSPILCSYRRNFCRLFVSNYIINYAKANGKNYHIYFYCVGMDVCMNIKLYE